MQGIRAVFSALLPNVYSGAAAIILDAHPVHKNRPKLAHSFDFRAKNLFRADSDKNMAAGMMIAWIETSKSPRYAWIIK